MSTEGSIVYQRTPRAVPIFRIMAACFFALGAWLMMVGADGVYEIAARVASLVSFGCFGFCTWLTGRRAKRRHSVYAINHDGFSLIGPDGLCSLFVDWNEVQGISATEMGYGKALSFAFRDPDVVKDRMTPEQRARALDNESVGLPTLTIPQSALDTDIDDIRTISQRFFFSR
jgi:hypothetical protein